MKLVDFLQKKLLVQELRWIQQGFDIFLEKSL